MLAHVFATIRGQLVLSFVVISIVAIAAMGGLSMAVIDRLVERRERDMLRETAAVIAAQSLQYFTPIADQRRLQHLAETSALMGDVRVWILDRNRQVLADSGRMSGYQFVWGISVVQRSRARSGHAGATEELPPVGLRPVAG